MFQPQISLLTFSPLHNHSLNIQVQKLKRIKQKENLSTTESSILITTLKDSSSSISPTSHDLNVKSTAENTENNIMLQTFSHPPISTTTEHSASYADQSISTTVYPNHIFNTEETSTTSKLITSGVIYQETTITTDSSSTLKMDVQSTSSQTHREGKHIPFSTASTDTSPYSFFIVTTDKITTALDETKIFYKQIQIEDLNLMDRTNMITAVIQFRELHDE
ncbi:uncharacterized protein CEXT_219191 [Caerostris extrusa]|uniref:Uncharacterized protein n=1 Tax=Caerostris extrusa TaxID=172846 RepID=A0AAV4XL80_CAEEX|nr:uncharacterized protein CEXT_219191 [Caerostris extrusa]